ncbi:MAG: PSD1 and planctomycete cytochrome C domain-containing protein, partial [Rubripirellula sp.]
MSIDRVFVSRCMFVAGVFSSVAFPALCATAEDSPTRKQIEFFEAKVRPLLIEHCYECHSRDSNTSDGELLLDSALGWKKGGTHGPTLIPGAPDESLLIRAVSYEDDDLQMPPQGKLPDDTIATLRQWIKMGAPDPREGTVSGPTASPLERDPSSHWAFIAPSRHTPTDAMQNAFDPIDAFAASRAAHEELTPNPIAPRDVLIRRLYFDLTGLPPSQDAISKFVASERPDAYRRLVDQLLATPDFGERFGRHWLDVSRYADTVGYALAGRERRLKGSERFRDWTIRAFASDMPYDEMLRHQLSGDRTDPTNEDGNLDAMGFLTVGRKFLNPLDTIDDRIDVITRGLLGLTVSCARCHDHKFDPIPTSDYYALGGIIFSSEQPKEGVSPLMMVDKKNPIDSPVLIRGQVGNHGPVAPRQFLTALRKKDEPRFTDGSGRKELADRIVSARNPLTARVMVNRIWKHLIGKPLVDTPSDFGFRTESPAVAEVLDDLSAEFATHWSVKRIVRRIVLSRIYQQTAETSQDAIRKDPDNRFLARANRKRRDFESLRDSILFTADSLDRALGGEPVDITLDTPAFRRTVYAMIDRQNLPSLFRTFDFASPDTHSPGRYFTTVPQQALFLMNSRQMLDLARNAADRVRQNHGSSTSEALAKAMFLRVLGREPDARELASSESFLNQPAKVPESRFDARSAWSYGIGTVDEEGRVTGFEPLKVFRDNRWQAGNQFPTESPYGHAFLSREDGHTPA